jgi:putative glutamine amidotransferase
MTKIGITYTGSDAKHDNYVRWITGDDKDIEIVRLSADMANLHEVGDIDGLVLSGGVDIDPELYDGALEYEKAPVAGWQTERDLFEQAALQLAGERGMPVLGVCRGLQLINVSCGGSLVQDLGEAGDATHENVTGVDKQHPVSVAGGSFLEKITGQAEGVVNSAHHQAIDQLGDGLRINCRAEDGTIEGIEWAEPEGKPFMLAVQWHPERMYTNALADGFLYQAIRDRFISEVRGRQ